MIGRCAGQLRLAPDGRAVLGIELAAALSLASALGYEVHGVAELLPAAEAGLVSALNKNLSPDPH